MNAGEILNSKKLKRTKCREGIIDLILNAKSALSEHEIREQLKDAFDRTTFYRSFRTLEEHHIIHKIVVDNHVVRYALDDSLGKHHDHVHFFCDECQSVKCIDSVPVQAFDLPHGFTSKETEVIIKGTCPDCKE
jgi:Fur family ferric uptake transcriptional regulator